MSSVASFMAFLVTTALYALLPGPAMIYAAARSLAGGKRAGLMAALGIHIGSYIHVFAAAAGLTVLFHAVPTLYAVVKLAGAAYLIWLGLRLFRTRDDQHTTALPHPEPTPGRRAFAQSVAVEILNPKTAVFFVAFLPQFIDPAAAIPVWLQICALGTIVNLMFSLVEVVCVVLAGAVLHRLRRSGNAQRSMRRVGGSVLIGLGARLVLEQTS